MFPIRWLSQDWEAPSNAQLVGVPYIRPRKRKTSKLQPQVVKLAEFLQEVPNVRLVHADFSKQGALWNATVPREVQW